MVRRWQIEVGAEGARELFGRDERLVQIPHETITDAVRVRLEFDANRYERHGPLCLLREPLLRTGAKRE
jgi:hypothetical protein